MHVLWCRPVTTLGIQTFRLKDDLWHCIAAHRSRQSPHRPPRYEPTDPGTARQGAASRAGRTRWRLRQSDRSLPAPCDGDLAGDGDRVSVRHSTLRVRRRVSPANYRHVARRLAPWRPRFCRQICAREMSIGQSDLAGTHTVISQDRAPHVARKSPFEPLLRLHPPPVQSASSIIHGTTPCGLLQVGLRIPRRTLNRLLLTAERWPTSGASLWTTLP